MAADNGYSRLVTWLKIVLPLTALAILSSLFLVSRTIDGELSLPYSTVDASDRLREPRLTRPTFSGISDDGAAVTVTAEDMRPVLGKPDEGTARDLMVRMESLGGTVTTLEAATGWMNSETEDVVLGGGVIVTTSNGYRLTAPDMTGSVARTDLFATGGVAGDSPFGPITSDTMQITPDPDAPGSHVIDFNGSVRLLYHPAE